MTDTRPAKAPGASILAVDDNPAVLRLIRTLLLEEGFSVTLAGSVAEAKQAITKDPRFDLVLSDVSMPVETGFDLLAWIKGPDSPNRELPVLLTTAQVPDAEWRLKGLEMGAVDYVVRPIDLKELVVRIVHAVENFRRIRSLEESLQDSQTQAMAGRLLAAANHEIKNLAAIVRMSADQIVKRFGRLTESDSRDATLLAALCDSAALLAEVTRGVGALFDRGSSPPVRVDLRQLTEEVVRMVTPRVRPHRLLIDSTAPTAPLWVEAQPIRLKQVLINLIQNAAEAIQDLGTEAGGQITVDLIPGQEKCRLLVTDNGIGLQNPGTRSDFEAFASTKRLKGGQGLGLWLCSQLMRDMGGGLSLTSEGLGKGAVAEVTLKSAPAAAAEKIDLSAYLLDDSQL